jgi:hypothetical protein
VLLRECGARCSRCGYDRNLAALAWHHLDPQSKMFSLDLRSLSNRREAEIRLEVAKCIVLCANCHAETHFPKYDVDAVSSLARTSVSRETRLALNGRTS